MTAGNFKSFNQRVLVEAFDDAGIDLHDWKREETGAPASRHDVVYDASDGRVWLVPRRAGSGPNIETGLVWALGKLSWK